MARDRDWNGNEEENSTSRTFGGERSYGRDDGDSRGGRYAEGRSWGGADRDYGERATGDRSQGRGGGHSLESFARGQSAAAPGYGQRGYGQIGVAQNRNDRGGVGQANYAGSRPAGNDYGPGDYYARENEFGGGYRSRDDRSGGYGGAREPIGAAANPYLADITEGEHRGRGPKNYSRSDDRIRDDVSDRLSDAADVDAREIEVTVESGEVTLSGTVESRRAKRRAEDLADDVSGVKHVQNNLRVVDQGQTRAMGDTLPRI